MTTEWEDIQRRIGNLPPLETKEQLDKLVDDVVQNYDPLEHKTLAQLDELEDDEDERVLEEYRKKRMAEMMEKASRERFGEIRQISEHEYSQEVTKAGDVWVVLLLFNDSEEAKLLNRILGKLAPQHRAVKFLRIRAQECIRNYPDRLCPTILVYHKGDLKKQFVTLDAFGGPDLNEQDVEWGLAQLGCVETELEQDPRRARSKVTRNFVDRAMGGNYDSDDD